MQFGQTEAMPSAQATQNVHSKLQIRASPASGKAVSHFSQVVRMSSIGRPYRWPPDARPPVAGSVARLAGLSLARGR